MNAKVGDKHNFTFSDKEYEVKEVLENPKITMWYTWNTSICPHCKQRIERTVQHEFYEISIVAPTNIEEKDLTLKDLILLGDTTDKRKMIISEDNEVFNQVLLLSKKFKKLIRGG